MYPRTGRSEKCLLTCLIAVSQARDELALSYPLPLRLEPLLFPFFPASLTEVLFQQQIPKPKPLDDRQLQCSREQLLVSQPSRRREPAKRAGRAGSRAPRDLLQRMVSQVHPAPRHGHGDRERDGAAHYPLHAGERPRAIPRVAGGIPGRLVAHEEEQDQEDGPEGEELRVGGGHAVALAVDAARSFLLDETLQGEIGGLAAELTQEHEGNFDLASGPDEGSVYDAEGLGQEGEPCAEKGEGIFGVLGGETRISLIVRFGRNSSPSDNDKHT